MAENFFGLTDLGRQRQNNEDTFVANMVSGNFIVAAVIDGVGGYSGGEIAAEIAKETILERLDKPTGEIIPLLVKVLHAANENIWQEKQGAKEYNSMACVATLAVVDMAANQFYYAHIGDTRLYLFRDGSLVKISHDQSFVGFLEDSGRITEKEAMQHPKRNEIDKALGFKSIFNSNSDDIETGHSPFLPGDMLLLCSDGLSDLVDKATITKILEGSDSLKHKGKELIDAANDAGGKDNITVVLVKNDKAPQQHTATKPLENSQTPEPRKTNNETTRATVKTAVSKQTSKKGLNILLLFLVIALAAVCVWQYIHYHSAGTAPVKPIDTPVVKRQNTQEIKLQNAINGNKGKVLILTDTAYKSPIVISKSITVDRDSLHIKIKGNIVLKSDPGFNGPAFWLTDKTKNIVLDSLSFQNFGVAISEPNQALIFKNVRFNNCKISLLNTFGFPNNKYVNGGLPAVIFKTDSLPKNK